MVATYTPCSVINAIKGKVKDHGIVAHESRRRNPATLSTFLFTSTITLEALGVTGQAEE
jgi:hypothetical protein